MEYALLGLFTILGEFFKALSEMVVTGSVTVASVIFVVIILRYFMSHFKIKAGGSGSSKSNGSSDSGSKESSNNGD